MLLEAIERRDVPIYVVVTMRSEFLGRCSEFTGLAEAFNRSQYLVPRLTRDERREAIERPLRLFGTEPAPALVQQVLNDTGDDPDQLPVMQHALLRTYRAWERAGATGRIERRALRCRSAESSTRSIGTATRSCPASARARAEDRREAFPKPDRHAGRRRAETAAEAAGICTTSPERPRRNARQQVDAIVGDVRRSATIPS